MINKIINGIKDFYKDEEGMATGEVVIIGGVLAVAALGFTLFVSGKLKTNQDAIGDALDGAGGATY